MSLVRFNSNDIRIQTDKLVTSTWTGNTNNLAAMYTSSLQSTGDVPQSPTSSAWFYLNVYDKDPSSSAAEVQYAVAYGHKAGSGSPDFTNDTGSFGMNASRTVYSQYRQLVYGEETQDFTFGTHVPNDIYVINVNRSRYKHGLSLSTLSLWISGAREPGSGYHATEDSYIHLTDDSISSNGAAIQTNIGRQFNIVSGASGVYTGSSAKQLGPAGGYTASYGLYYPDAGLIILNGDAFDHEGTAPYRARGLHSNYTTYEHFNNERMYNAISGGMHFIVDSEEVITSQYYFARAKNYEFNYTNNPSFQDNNGNLTFQSMISNPKTYITTVGLYNDNSELLAVAKLSQPVAKDFTKEALFRIKLDY